MEHSLHRFPFLCGTHSGCGLLEDSHIFFPLLLAGKGVQAFHCRVPVKIKGTAASAPIVIEDNVLVGARCIILKGVTIGARSIIGSGSIVTKDIPSDCIAAGNPCKVIKSIVY